MTYEKWKKERIHRDPAILGGALVFKGTRISVCNIGLVAQREKPSEVYKDYPDLFAKDVEYAQRLMEKEPEVAKLLPAQKKLTYTTVCISIYYKDLKRLDEMVNTLRARGDSAATRSGLIRAALNQVDLNEVPSTAETKLPRIGRKKTQ